jgi:SNF family Na+-dependent transporter
MWNPRTEDTGFLQALGNPQMWLDATGQIFFSLSVGFGIIITYSSYLKANDDIALSSLTSAAGNEFCEVALGGMITIPAAFIFLGAATVTAAAGSSFDLGFQTLPMVFESMPLGYAVGFLFFFLLFLAAVTSSLSMLQPAIALLEEGLGLNRRASVAILGFVTLCGAMFTLYFSKDSAALDTLDTWVGTFFIYLLAMFQTILFGWVLGPDRGIDELRRGAEIHVPRLVGWNLRYVAPVYLFVVFAAFLYQQIVEKKGGMFRQIFEEPVVGASVGFILLVIVFFLLIIAQSVKRWHRAERQPTEFEV